MSLISARRCRPAPAIFSRSGHEFVVLVERLLDQHFAVADDGVERRPQLVAHGGEEPALGLVGGFGVALGRLELHLAVLELGDVGIDGDGRRRPACAAC